MASRNPIDVLRGEETITSMAPKILSFLWLGIIAVFFILVAPFVVETNNAGWYVVKQAAGSGTLTAHVKPGMFWQMFGDVSFYKSADTVHFAKKERGPVAVRFNDGAQSEVVVNVRYELPTNPEKLLELHTRYRSYESLVRETIEQVVRESVLLSAALMSTEESYTTRRGEFAQLAEDQVTNGVYLTEARIVETKDSKTGESTRRQIVSIQQDKNGKPIRKPAVLDDHGIIITQFIVQDIDYSEEVDTMIQAKQKALQQVVSAKAQAEKSIQDRLTAEEEGKKNVAVARYQQEVEKAVAITSAEKELEVARLGQKAAEQYKLTQILKAEGDSEYRRKMMIADGALDKRLDAYVKTQLGWASAFAESKNPVVPSVVMGSGQSQNNAATSMMDMLAIKAARDLSLDLKAKE